MVYLHALPLARGCSILLYMKTRVTFRVAPDLAATLRELPNQTQFVEQALREALRERCPACNGTGRLVEGRLRVSNLRTVGLPSLSREAALQLKGLVALARRARATSVDLRREAGRTSFVVTRGTEILLEGALERAGVRLLAPGGRS